MISKNQSSLTSFQGKNGAKKDVDHMLIKARPIQLLCMMLVSLFISLNSSAQHLYQAPKPLQKKADLEKIIGELDSKTSIRKLNILWVYGYDKHHISGAHDYVKVKDMMTGLLKKVQDVTVSEAFHFPTNEQFDNTDLIVMYVHLPKLSAEQYENFQNYIKNGGVVVSLHETVPRKERNYLNAWDLPGTKELQSMVRFSRMYASTTGMKFSRAFLKK
ncbi:MAG: hypothetical protein ACI9FN_003313 [Saprospiraceae bacterium]